MLGNVLAKTIDVGDDAAIHAHDQQLLARAHVMIADVTIPSTGTGYMIARAAARGLPILCLYLHGTRPSAMIAGSPDVTTRFYADDSEWLDHVRAFLLAHAAKLPAIRGQRIFLAGPPGCGKGTLGRSLAKATGAPHVSTGELLRPQRSAASLLRARALPRTTVATSRDAAPTRLASLEPKAELPG